MTKVVSRGRKEYQPQRRWNDSVDSRTVENELHVVSRHLVVAMHRKYGGSNDSQEDQRAEEEG